MQSVKRAAYFPEQPGGGKGTGLKPLLKSLLNYDVDPSQCFCARLTSMNTIKVDWTRCWIHVVLDLTSLSRCLDTIPNFGLDISNCTGPGF